MGRSKTVRLQFTDVGTNGVKIAAGSKIVYAQYKLNDAYDIDAQLGSYSITGYPQWAAFFQKYLVTWASMTVTFINSNTIPVYVGIVMRPVTNEATWNTWKGWREIPGNGMIQKSAFLGIAGGGGDRITLSIKAPLWKVHGNKSQYYGDTLYGSAVDANPRNVIDGFVYALTPTDNNASDPLIIWTHIRISIYCKFSERKLLIGSSSTLPVDTVLNTFLGDNPGGDVLPVGDVV